VNAQPKTISTRTISAQEATVQEQLTTQAGISAEIAAAHRADTSSGTAALRDFPPYRSSALRHPTQPLVVVDPDEVELHSPVFGVADVGSHDHDLTLQHAGEPLGERIVVHGRIVDGNGHPVRNQLVEVWQANASGRYVHIRDQHPAPLDPNFTGTGRCLTDAEGNYRFISVKPGAYPWRNHRNAWRPAHIHFSLFGTAFTERLVTQMYFPGDPLFAYDPILNAIPDERARNRLVSTLDIDETVPEWALAYRWDIVLGGARSTPVEDSDG
jgi:protocatechuate 3,4-dioxygenase beta subunit